MKNLDIHQVEHVSPTHGRCGSVALASILRIICDPTRRFLGATIVLRGSALFATPLSMPDELD